MSKITRQDSNGVKPLLGTGELGYDNYPAGGDAGRVFVGTGTENIPLAKKEEVALKLDSNKYTAMDVLNKIKTVDGNGSGINADLLDGQEGTYYLNASNINAGTINDARLPDTITSSITGNSATATKLATARTINGKLFDGSANITVSDSSAVKLTGNETIAGVKTFTSSPIVPTPITDFQSVPLRSTNITVNVGAGQTYTTINQALEYLSGFYPMYKRGGITATINLKAGFVMAEQVLVSGIDLGWITIVGEDAETIITHTALTTGFYTAGYPAFGVDKGGTSPIIGQLFRFNVEKVGGGKHGLLAWGAGSSANVLSGKGFIGAGTNGIYAAASSVINASGANCRNAGTNGIHAVRSSVIDATDANCSNAGTNGIYAAWSSVITAYGANCSNAGTNGIHAVRSSVITASSANCSNAGTNGIYAAASSVIDANVALVQNQTTGAARVRVQDGSHIEASGIIITGGNVTVLSQTANTLTGNGIIYQ